MTSSRRHQIHTSMQPIFLLLALTCCTGTAALKYLNVYPVPNASTTFVRSDVLEMTNDLLNRSLSRVEANNPPAQTELTAIPRMVKLVFPLLYPSALDGTDTLNASSYSTYHSNTRAYLQHVSQVNEPFVADVSPESSDLRTLFERFSNSTVDASIAKEKKKNHTFIGETYFFPGGVVSVHLLSGSIAYSVYEACNSIEWYRNGTKLNGSPHYEFWRSFPPLKSVLISMQPDTAPWYCTRSAPGTVLDDHGEGSQRLWTRFADSIGNVTTDELMNGNQKLNMTEDIRVALEKIADHDVGVAPSRMSDMVKATEAQYERGVEQYDNVAFLILSVAAILSSTAVATVSPGREWDRIVIVLVEAAVVYSFLAIVTHSMAVLVRTEAYAFDLTSNVLMNFSIPGHPLDIVVAHTNFSYSVVGERTHFPMKLVVTEAVSVLAAIIVTGTVVMAFWTVKHGKPAAKLPKVTDMETCDLDDSVGVAGSVGIDDMEEEREHRQTVFAWVYNMVRGRGARTPV